MNRKLGISLIVLLVAVLVSWTAFLMSEKNIVEDTWIPRIQVNITTWVVQQNVSENNKLLFKDALNNVDTSSLSWDEIIRYAMASLPMCWVPGLYRIPNVISDHVQNCRRKAKKGSFPDWLWGVFLNSYTYDTNSHSVVSITSSFWLNSDGNIQVDWYNPVCSSFLNGYPEVAYTVVKDWKFIDESAKSFFTYSWAAYALEKGLAKEYLTMVDYLYDDWMLYINQDDEDLPINYWVGAWSDGSWNYFMAWHSVEGKFLYQINDILFDPGQGNGNKDNLFDESNNKWDSRWYFWWFRDWKVIVNRFLEYHYLWTTVSFWTECADGYCWDKTKNASEFLLESCELDLDTFNLNS